MALQVLPSMEFSKQEYWSGLPFLSPWGLPDPWIEPRSPVLQADSLQSQSPGKNTSSTTLPINTNTHIINQQVLFDTAHDIKSSSFSIDYVLIDKMVGCLRCSVV